jgi:hypothetical protein
VEHGGTHEVMRGPHVMMIKCSTWKRRKRKTKPWRSRQRYIIGFVFGDQDTVESVITFRIDSRTIKRENLG